MNKKNFFRMMAAAAVASVAIASCDKSAPKWTRKVLNSKLLWN